MGCVFSMIGKILLIVGGLNWGLVGVEMLMEGEGNWNVVNLLLGSLPMVEAIVYILVGLSAVMMIFGCKCNKCSEACASCGAGNTDQKM